MKNIFFALRIFVGLVFVVSGTEKLLQPYQNFLYVIQSYQVLPCAVLEKVTALAFPWVELTLGCFLIIGLWLRWTLIGLWFCTLTFIIIIGQAQVRMLPISECGCFGDLIKVPLAVTMRFDSILLLTITLLLFSIPKSSFLSLDRFFQPME